MQDLISGILAPIRPTARAGIGQTGALASQRASGGTSQRHWDVKIQAKLATIHNTIQILNSAQPKSTTQSGKDGV